MKNLLKTIPIPICGLILAILTLGNLLEEYIPEARIICGTIGFLFLLIIFAKIISFPREIIEEIKNPIIASISGTFLMALIVLSTYIIPFNKDLGFILWIFAIIAFIALIVYFTLRFIFNLELKNTYASYYIVYIGIAIASVTAPVHNQELIGQIIFYFSSISFILLLILTSYRYLKLETPDQFKPLICINAAPFSLLLLGYLKSFNIYSHEFILFMLIFAVIFYIFSLYKLFEYRNLPFYPSFAAFSFPFVVSAFCMKEANKYFISLGMNLEILNLLTVIEIIIATVLVIYVLIRYLKFLAEN
ncbi:TDT family transporter [uncultured Methanobrevibacter sp.]|uniref:TDT family transporter n=1 Tax=uncultured Methanobrevibacter sp. TaxID=253161 RepID=UPI002604FED0